jgi:hypothetical protein
MRKMITPEKQKLIQQEIAIAIDKELRELRDFGSHINLAIILPDDGFVVKEIRDIKIDEDSIKADFHRFKSIDGDLPCYSFSGKGLLMKDEPVSGISYSCDVVFAGYALATKVEERFVVYDIKITSLIE